MSEESSSLKNFKLVDCAVRSPEHFYFIYSHIYQMDSDANAQSLREAIRVAIYFPNKPIEKRWAFRTLRNIEFIKGAVAEVPLSQLICVSLDGQVYVLGSGVSEFEKRVPEGRFGPLRGSVRQVVVVDKMAYAVQGNRGLCRRTAPNNWESLCAHLSGPKSSSEQEVIGFNCAAGLTQHNIYAGGAGGDLWLFSKGVWQKLGFPTQEEISHICCREKDDIYIGTKSGSIYRGYGHQWQKISELVGLQSLVVYQNQIWCSSSAGVSVLQNDKQSSFDLPLHIQNRYGLLAVRDSILLIGSDFQSTYYDGHQWIEVN